MMMELKINAEVRVETGTNSSKKIRNAKMVPAVVYGRDEETVHVSVDERDFRKINREAGAASIIGLSVDGEEIPVIIKEVQKHPIKDIFLHVDFQKINMKETIRIILPITLENRDDIKTQPSTLIQQLDEIEIEALPANLPGDIVIDVQNMEIGDSIEVGDLEIAKDETITILRDLDDVVCSLSEFVEEDLDEIDDEADLDVEPELVSDSEDEDEEVEE